MSVDLWTHDVCSDCPVSSGPGLSWDSLRAFHKSTPNEFGNHAPSSRGLDVHPSRCTPCWPVHSCAGGIVGSFGNGGFFWEEGTQVLSTKYGRQVSPKLRDRFVPDLKKTLSERSKVHHSATTGKTAAE